MTRPSCSRVMASRRCSTVRHSWRRERISITASASVCIKERAIISGYPSFLETFLYCTCAEQRLQAEEAPVSGGNRSTQMPQRKRMPLPRTGTAPPFAGKSSPVRVFRRRSRPSGYSRLPEAPTRSEKPRRRQRKHVQKRRPHNAAAVSGTIPFPWCSAGGNRPAAHEP